MPTYEYKCEKCGHRFDILQSMTAAPLTSCEKCGGRVKRMIGAGSGIIFKGSGFYATDYKKKDRNKGGSGGGKDAGDKKSEPPCKTGGGDCSSCSMNKQ